jgi:predicted NACHT family NTPase
VNSPANLSPQRQFLEEIATHYSFTGDRRTVFLSRFDPINLTKDNTVLVGFIDWNKDSRDKAQKLQDELKNICQVLEKDGCLIDKPKRGRQPKGKSPWEQAFKWLWDKFPEWQPKQIVKVPSEQVQKTAFSLFLKNIEDKSNELYLLHRRDKPIVLKDQYIPIQVTRERRYNHLVESIWSYSESETELKRIYALKGLEDEPTQVDWAEAKQQHRRIMVLADPGMGKSTLLKMEAGLIAQEAWNSLANNVTTIEDVTLPLLIRLSELAEATKEPEAKVIEAIPKLIQAKCKNLEEIKVILEDKLQKGQCILLLDALDEVPNEQRNRLSEKLNYFLDHHPCPIICTSRIVGYGGGFMDGGKDVEIVPFTQPQTEKYIEIWFKNAAGYLSDETVSASELIQELRNKPQVGGLAQNPLLLSLICSLYQEKGLTLPARRCQVYEKAVDYMLGKWSQNRKPKPQGRIIAKTRLLEELAYHFSCEGKEIFSSDELYDQLEEYL